MNIAITYAPSEQQFIPVPPLGISVLSTVAKDNGIKADVIDLELELWLKQNGKSSLFAENSVEELKNQKLPVESLYDVLCNYEILTFTVMGKRQIEYVLNIVKMLKEKNSSLKYVILGGAFFNETNSKDLLLKYKNLINFTMIGEGYASFPALLKKLNNNEKIESSILGVCFLNKKSEFIYTPGEKWNKELPLPDYETTNKEGYIKQQKTIYGLDDSNIIYHLLVGDRRCPFRCSFCRISEDTKAVKKPEDIADEMIKLNKLYGCKYFSLICNEMNPSLEYFHRFLDTLLSYDEKLMWFCYLRPGLLDLETLKKARKAGCVLIRYGVETGSQKILDHMNKKLYVDEIKKIMQYTHEAGIWNHINIVTGYLHETEDDVQLTLDFIEEYKEYIDSVRINPFYLPINSPIHLNPEKYGITIRNNTGSYVEFDEPDCTFEEKQNRIKKTTSKILEKCIDSDINFAGILPFLVASAMAYFGDVKTVKKWIKEKHGYLCSPVSPDTAKWCLAHPENRDVVINSWDSISGKRGDNYQSYLQKKNDEADSY